MIRCPLSNMQSADSIPSPWMTPSQPLLRLDPNSTAALAAFPSLRSYRWEQHLFMCVCVGGEVPFIRTTRALLGKGILRNLPAGASTRTLWSLYLHREGLLGVVAPSNASS